MKTQSSRTAVGLVAIWAVVIGTAQTAPPLIVETAPLTPAEQQEQFQLPEGFRIELIASEPDIGQPMNLNFDAAGRLWVSHSVEYPYPVEGEHVEPRDERFGPAGKPPAKDRVSVISGIGTDKLEVTHFAEGLNIPIGLVPLTTDEAIIYSIPYVTRWQSSVQSPVSRETTNDRSGSHQPINSSTHQLLGPFGNLDTHGMVNGLTRWVDGWIYACHGFRNTSKIHGTDGHEIDMNSGHTFRFRPDGSHVEIFTHGQVNPYGLTFDPWGNIYTADCHSKPLTCLIPGAYYTSFGKPHDGLGFGPDMIDHSHGSTGICGPCYYAADHFPPDYRDCLYLCNPVTGIVHRDKLIWHGSTPRVDTQPEFITCKDGWFRPVDIKLGPDGALYIADFYNAIIGHYEVPLENPKRDRTHGRVWRVSYVGNEPASGGRQSSDDVSQPAMPGLTQESPQQLIARLGDFNLTVRMLASHLLADRPATEIEPLLRAVLQDESAADVQQAHSIWLLHRFNVLTEDDRLALAAHPSPLVRTHAARVYAATPEWSDKEHAQAAELLNDENAQVKRAAAEAWAVHSEPRAVGLLLKALVEIDSSDTHLRHALRIALRNSTALPGMLTDLGTANVHTDHVASVCLAIPSEESAVYLLNALKATPQSNPWLAWTSHIAKHGTADTVAVLIDVLRERTQDDVSKQVSALRAIEAAKSYPQGEQPEAYVAWATETAHQLLSQVKGSHPNWKSRPLNKTSGSPLNWGTEVRPATDGKPTRLWSSLPGGEQGVGIYHSPHFRLPQRLSFWLAGHDGFPQDEPAGQNVVRLVSSQDGRVLQSAAVPRQDAPTLIEWEFDKEAVGEQVRLDLVDGLNLNAYAWIAAGRFSVDELNPQEFIPSELAGELIGSLELQALQSELERLLKDEQTGEEAVRHLSAAHLKLRPDPRLQAVLPLLVDAPTPTLPARIQQQIVERDDAQIETLLGDAMRAASSQRQREMADALVASGEGGRLLVDLIASGLASPQLLSLPVVAFKLDTVADADLKTRVRELTANLPPANEELTGMISARRTSFDASAASAERGREVFKKSCAVCHQIGDEGKKVGPQLDGIGIRGLDRLLEDTLDPNRNVDAAFRSTTIVTNDGRVLTGLLRREEGKALILADSKGEEFRVPLADIDEQALSPLSLMPEDVAAKLPPDDLHDLLAFLLAQTQKSE